MGSNPTLSSLMAQTLKNLPAMQETQVPSLGQEDPLEKTIAIHFDIISSLVGYSPWGCKELNMT